MLAADPEQLAYEQAPTPSAGPGEVLIAVHAAAITFAELTWDLEWTTRDGTDRTPVIPSHEMSGIIADLGARVAGLAAGDEVIGLIDFDHDGAAAEYVVMPGGSLAREINPVVRGWTQYYGAFYRFALLPLLRRINAYLMRWLRKKYKRLASKNKARACWERVTAQYPRLFAHWAWVPYSWWSG